MKNLKFINKIVFVFNTIAATLLLLSYILPFLKPKSFSLLSVLSLAVPLLIILNLLFALYWLLNVKRQILLSLIVLTIGYKYLGSFYKFSGTKDLDNQNNLTVMSYNVRLFNVYDWLDEKEVDRKIIELIAAEEPDIICFQEYHPTEFTESRSYKYHFQNIKGSRMRHGLVTWSKYPIVNSGVIEFEKSANSAIYTDIVHRQDTIRVYNIHLQSTGINAEIESINSRESQRLFRRTAETFRLQQDQAETLVKHMSQSPFKNLVCGDFNNTAYSYVYKSIRGTKLDAFEEAGNGFGRTFSFRYFPVRIDFILADPTFEINHFRTIDKKLSDHYPILSRVALPE